GAADAEPPDRTRFLADGILAQQVDAAGIGRVLAVEHVKAGAFSRAVRADQRQDLAGLQRERDVAHGMNAAIRLAQAFDRQQCFRRAHSAVSTRVVANGDFGDEFLRRLMNVSSVPTMPLGKATTIRTMKPPSTSFERSVWLTSQMFSAL